MRALLRSWIINTAALWLAAEFIPGLDYSKSFYILFLAGGTLVIINLIIKPLVKLLTLPINLLTLGVFSLFIDALMLFLVTLVVNDFKITGFDFNGLTFSGLVIPAIYLPAFWSYFLSSFVINFFKSLLNWIFNK